MTIPAQEVGVMKKHSRRDFLAATGAALSAGPFLLSAAGSAPSPPRRRPPNVVLVITDDQGYGDLRCHGNPDIETPNFDHLYARSVRLTDFHVDPTCAPTRSALMTGRYSSRTGVWHTIMGRSLLCRDEVTMADVFAASGYRTGIFGKWHLGDNYPFRPQDRGFDEVVVHGGGGIGQTPDFWGNDYFDDTYWHNGKPQRYQGYCTDVFFAEALAFIERNKDRPFFLYLPTNAPHGPYNVPEKYRRLYLEKGLPDREARFYGMITNIDENMGRLLARLKQLGLEENTIVIFMTDNGTAAGSPDAMRGRKGSEYDGGHRVPCFISWPGHLEGGRDIGRIAAHIDVLPTLIELCGLKRPEGVEFDGKSLVPLLAGKGPWPDRTLFVHSQRIDHPRKWRKCAVMTDRWRLVNGRELYDIKADPEQKHNVADDHPDLVRRFRSEYEKWWESISVRFGSYCRIVIGSDRENPSRLTAHDWHGPVVPWAQGMIRNGRLFANGFWAIEVARDGRYRFTLRREPVEANFPIGATKARLRVGGLDVSKAISPEATGATFEVALKAGKTRLETWFVDERSGKSRGAYYVYVERLGGEA